MRLPYLNVDLNKVAENIKMMVDKAKAHQVEFRPHFKTHQSTKIGEMFRKHSVTGITVSSVYMADYFSKHGWQDITIAFPASLSSSNLYNEILKRSALTLLAVDADVVRAIDKQLLAPVSVYIEIDPGYGRSGVAYDDHNAIERLIAAMDESEHILFDGFYCHSGHSYKCASKDEVIALTDPILNKLNNLRTKFGGNVCFGDTPSCSLRNDFRGIDQISPGNFVFYDWMQHTIGACTPEQIAVTLNCEVVAKYPQRNEVLIHGGAVHFSKDFIINSSDERVFGVLTADCNHENPSIITSLSQEHGLVSCSPDTFESVKIGDVLEFYPIHSCLTANLMREYVSKKGEVIPQFGSGSPYQS